MVHMQCMVHMQHNTLHSGCIRATYLRASCQGLPPPRPTAARSAGMLTYSTCPTNTARSEPHTDRGPARNLRTLHTPSHGARTPTARPPLLVGPAPAHAAPVPRNASHRRPPSPTVASLRRVRCTPLLCRLSLGRAAKAGRHLCAAGRGRRSYRWPQPAAAKVTIAPPPVPEAQPAVDQGPAQTANAAQRPARCVLCAWLHVPPTTCQADCTSNALCPSTRACPRPSAQGTQQLSAPPPHMHGDPARGRTHRDTCLVATFPAGRQIGRAHV